ncbi:uncharacterized protein AMSG_12031 [Thecamonas trahens ATCC 50062]|uniref:EF-hand domain-containing protein n=1 Tax=Thecamonas trahens ATCC 50062 TaxID=461836 RepID=A0A0L0DFW8_THETB|nr:hypothetical protein AMSG_12031 [Thecamonas trahens ATCC 50062]KNC51065.1 hypothetical protein AMSG_12031 [Thecamonas trahens ATCC 50062]|eukprot:XP_013756562.1 hypothetical protein AMSG_12031 [Thecamonas trahens ATCC 50062]
MDRQQQSKPQCELESKSRRQLSSLRLSESRAVLRSKSQASLRALVTGKQLAASHSNGSGSLADGGEVRRQDSMVDVSSFVAPPAAPTNVRASYASLQPFTSYMDELHVESLVRISSLQAAILKFEEADEDESGGLDLGEFVDAFGPILGTDLGVDTDKVEELFHKIDANQDGTVDAQEFIDHFISTSAGMLGEVPESLDAGGSSAAGEAAATTFARDPPPPPPKYPLAAPIAHMFYAPTFKNYMAVASDGTLAAYKTTTLERVLTVHAPASAPRVTCATYISDFETLALGAHDFRVHMYKLEGTNTILGFDEVSTLKIGPLKSFRLKIETAVSSMSFRDKVPSLANVPLALDYTSLLSDPDRALFAIGDDTSCVSIFGLSKLAVMTDDRGLGHALDVRAIRAGDVPTSLSHIALPVSDDEAWMKGLVLLPSASCEFAAAYDLPDTSLVVGSVRPDGAPGPFRIGAVPGGVHSVATWTTLSQVPFLATGGRDTRLRVWKPSILTDPLLVFTGHTAPIAKVVPGLNDYQLLSLDTGNTVKVWDIRVSNCLATFAGVELGNLEEWRRHGMDGPPDAVTQLLPDRLRRRIVASSNELYSFSRVQKREHALDITHYQPLVTVVHEPYFGNVVTASEDGTVAVWSVTTGTKIKEFAGATRGDPLTAMILCNKTRIATASRTGKVFIWNFMNGKFLKELHNIDSAEVSDLAFAHQHSAHNTFVMEQVARVTSRKAAHELLTTLRPTEDNKYVIAVGWSRRLAVWRDTKLDADAYVWKQLPSHGGVFDDDGESAGESASRRARRARRSRAAAEHGVDVSSSGWAKAKARARAETRARARAMRARTAGKASPTPRRSSLLASTVAWEEDSEDDEYEYEYEYDGGGTSEFGGLGGHDEPHREDVLCCEFYPPNLLASAAYDGEIVVWNLNSQRELQRMQAPEHRELVESSHAAGVLDHVAALDAASIGAMTFVEPPSRAKAGGALPAIAAGSGDGIVRIWQLWDTKMPPVTTRRPPEAETSVKAVAYDPMLSMLFVGDSRGRIGVYSLRVSSDPGAMRWSVDAGLVALVQAHAWDVPLVSLQIVSSRRKRYSGYLVSGASDSRARLWRVSPGAGGLGFIGTFGQPAKWNLTEAKDNLPPDMPRSDDESDTESGASDSVALLAVVVAWRSMSAGGGRTDSKYVRDVVGWSDPDDLEELRRKLGEYNKNMYDAEAEKLGFSFAATKWSSLERQEIRFDVLANYTDGFHALDGQQVVDVGCGQGALFEYVRKNAPAVDMRYIGIDVSKVMVRTANVRHGLVRGGQLRKLLKRYPVLADVKVVRGPKDKTRPKFVVQDFLDPDAGVAADYYVCSGCMTIGDAKLWDKVSKPFVVKMGRLSRRGMYFNMLSQRHMKSYPGFAFYDYDEICQWLATVFPDATIHARHDYLEFRDFSIFVEF